VVRRRAIDEPPAWITGGLWFTASIRESLINANDIFVSLYETFNWSRVKLEYGLPFPTFHDLADNLTETPDW
jgi:hypothetical protein